ncbi:MAG: hypothetical protein AAF699_20320, partial [Pseudomonadota bacterium]
MIRQWFTGSPKYDGVRPVNVALMRVIYALMFFVLGADVWGYILNHPQPWDENEAVAWSVWAAFSALALLGMLRPIQMIPVFLLEIFYKVLWLALVAYPLWKSGSLQGSGMEETTGAFALVVLPIIAVPWGYVFERYVLG